MSNCVVIPTDKKLELDYLVLADIFTTAWWGLGRSGFKAGDTVAVFGAGPVGLLVAYSAIIQGASRVYSVDEVPQRLRKAKEIGAIPIDFADGDPVKQILKHEPLGVQRSVEACGYDNIVRPSGIEQPNLTVKDCVNVTGTNGGISVIGVFLPKADRKHSPQRSYLSITSYGAFLFPECC